VDAAEKTAFELGKALVADIREKRVYFDQRQAIDANRREFQAKIRAAKDAWRNQYAYWEKRGWS
jgi:hypothetical protein